MLILVGVTVTVALNGGLFEKTREATQRTSREKAIEELNIITADFNADLYANPEKYKKIFEDGNPFNKLKEEIESRIPEDSDSYIITDLNLENYDNEFELYFSLLKERTSDYYILDIPFVYKGVRADWEIKITYSDDKDEIEYIELVLEEKTGTTLISMYCADENCTNEEHLHKGDYVWYTPTKLTLAYNPDKGETAGTYTGYTTETQSIEQEMFLWRVLGTDKDDNVLLISETPTKQKLTLYGHVGYNNCESVLKETCEALYSNKELGATARSITMDDINTYLGGNKYYVKNWKSDTEEGLGTYWHLESYFEFNTDTNILTRVTEPVTCDFILNYYRWYTRDVSIGSLNETLLFPNMRRRRRRLLLDRLQSCFWDQWIYNL